MTTSVTDVQDVVRALNAIQPVWVDGGYSHGQAKATADAYRESITKDTLAHHVHTLWMLERALEWAEHDCMVESDCEPPAYVAPDECDFCKANTPWHRDVVDELKRTKLVIAAGDAVVFAKGASPADSLQAGIELGFPYFSHLWGDYPVYSKTERRV